MRRSNQVLAPLLTATALALLTGCNGSDSPSVNNMTFHVLDSPFRRTSALSRPEHLINKLEQTETRRGGFGDNFAAVVIGSAIAMFIIRSGG